MFKIDKSAVEYINSNKSSVIIKKWVKQDNEEKAEQPSFSIPQPEQTEAEAAQAVPAAPAAPRTSPDLEKLAMDHAQKLIDDAQDQADLLLEKADAESSEIRQAAYDEGFQQGLTEAREAETEHVRAIQEQFQSFLDEVRKGEQQRDEELTQNVLRLSLEISEKIINIELEKNDIVFMGMVQEAVKRLHAKEKFTIHLNKREYDRFFAKGSGWLSDAVQTAPFSAMSDANVPPGGLVLTGEGGMVRAGVDTQLGKIKKALITEDE